MARDDFSRQTIDRLAKRAGMRCSNPDCRTPTSGPSAEPGDVTNTGVAAHICAASPGGARYEEEMSSEARSAITNGIWLCQNHAKLIDDDEVTFSASILREWKETAEHMAALEARGFKVHRARPFGELEKDAPKLIAEMRQDIAKKRLVREFVLLPNRRITYHASYDQFIYYIDEHQYVENVVIIMQHLGAVYDSRFNDIPRFRFTEEFARFLLDDE
uniref:HNH endonuclease n=1 Tax=Rhodopseudomonas palustris (strain DX-1) TaxID=652103 RepID=E6VL04_RHOPX